MLRVRFEEGVGEERLELSLEYYRKYPSEPFYMNRIAGNIEYILLEDPGKREKYMPLLNEVCDKLMDKPLYREYAIRVMTVVCPEDELDHWLKMSTVTSEYTRRGNLLHRFIQRDDIEGWQIQSQLQMIEKFTLLFDAVCPDQLGPEKKGEYLRSQLAMMEWLKTDGTMPDGWILHYAYKKLVLAACLFATEKTDEGWAEFEKSMELYRKWFSFPKDALLDLGGGELFGGLRVTPDWYYCFTPSGEKHKLFEHTRLFFYTPDRLRDFLNNPRWAWYNSARSDPRYIAAVEWADSLSKTE